MKELLVRLINILKKNIPVRVFLEYTYSGNFIMTSSRKIDYFPLCAGVRFSWSNHDFTRPASFGNYFPKGEKKATIYLRYMLILYIGLYH